MIVDIETDGLLDEVTKIHVVSYAAKVGDPVTSLTDYDDMREFFASVSFIVGHNIIRYDKRAIEKVLGIKITCPIYDTLPMSWVMFTDLVKHGLEEHGVRYGVPKPKVVDWKNAPVEVYVKRCEEDVKINCKLWEDLIRRFKLVYGDKREDMNNYFKYLSFKMECAAKAEDSGWMVDVDMVRSSLSRILIEQEEKVEELKKCMPLVAKYKEKKRPKNMTVKDGSPSALAIKWYELLDEHLLPHDHEEPVKVLDKMEEPNPNSPDQVKEWLFSLGWEPCSFDFKKNDDGSERKIPQVRVDGPEGKELAPSVKALIRDNPEVEVLDGLTVLQHRKSIFEGILEHMREDEEGNYFVRASIGGLTNTLRFKHKSPLVNLPGVDKPWGKEIRGSLIAPKDHVLCGADMVSLEDTTKRHYIKPYDPDFVAEMEGEDFDPHLKLAMLAGAITQNEYNFFLNYKNKRGIKDVSPEKQEELFKRLSDVRSKAKTTTYSATYGVGKSKLARTAGTTEREAEKLLEGFWKLNWAVKAFAEDQTIRTVGGQMWVLNPVNNYWYTLRYKKDVFSTINQGTGAYCFDQWVAHYLTKRPNIVGQFHDESANYVPDGEQEEHTKVLKWAIGKVNEKLNLNVELDIDVKYGGRYSEIH